MSGFVCLDVGNVLLEVDLEHFSSVLKNFIPDHHDPMFFLEYLQPFQDIGLSTVKKALKAQYDIHNEEHLNVLLEAWNGVLIPNIEMKSFLENLLKGGVQVAILSNIGEEHLKCLKTIYPQIDFCVHWFSCEVGARKPSKIYFQNFILQYPEWKGAIYLDDRSENLATGKEYDLKSIQFELDKFKLLSIEERTKKLEKIKEMILEYV